MPDPTLRHNLTTRPSTVGAVTIPVLGIPTRFVSDSAEVLEVAEEAFGGWYVEEPLWADGEHEPVEVRIMIRPGREDPEEPAPRYAIPEPTLLLARSGGSHGWADAMTRTAEAEVSPELLSRRALFRYTLLESLTLAVLTRLDREPLHAAAVGRGGTALLLAGRSGTGKSSLTYAALRAGLRVFSEDKVFLEANPFRMWGMPSVLHLPVETVMFFPELEGRIPTLRANGKLRIPVLVREVGVAAVPPVANRAGVCLLARGSGSGSLQPIHPDTAVRELTSELEPGFDLFAETIPERVRQVAEQGAWRLEMPPHPADAVPFLFEGLEQLEQR